MNDPLEQIEWVVLGLVIASAVLCFAATLYLWIEDYFKWRRRK